MLLIPDDATIHLQMANLCRHAKVIVFVGLPGTGKSLYINHLYHYAHQEGYLPQLIQWDVCRKEFEKGELKSTFPTKQGQVHPGVRLSAGKWLLSYLKKWHQTNLDNANNKLFIEAPLVGSRFSELCHIQEDNELEQLLRSEKVQFILPIPNNEVRAKIESDRITQVSETAQDWSGAKPSVLLQLWKDTLAIARKLDITRYQEEDYQAHIYQSTYQYILRHRHTCILDIDKIYDVAIADETSLHSLKNQKPKLAEVIQAVTQIHKTYSSEKQMLTQIDKWYKT